MALCAALLTLVLAPSGAWLARHWGHPPDPRWSLYERVGDWLRAHSLPGDAVASMEVGFLGYRSRRPVLDLMGLVSPGVLASRERGTLAELVAARSPRFLLDVPRLRGLGLGALLASPAIAAEYAPVRAFPQAHGGVARLLERRASETAREPEGRALDRLTAAANKHNIQSY